jgi:hypothetical protein
MSLASTYRDISSIYDTTVAYKNSSEIQVEGVHKLERNLEAPPCMWNR